MKNKRLELISAVTGMLTFALITGAHAQAPELELEHQDGYNLSNGGNSSLGAVELGANASQTFTIRNTGNDDLDLTGTPKVIISGPQASDFTVTALPSSPVASSSTTTFTIQFTPGATGWREATLALPNNDTDESGMSISLNGQGRSFVVDALLYCDFDATTLRPIDGGWLAQLTKENLDSSTFPGAWTVNQFQPLPNVQADICIRADPIGQPSQQKKLLFPNHFSGTPGANTPFITANLSETITLHRDITFSFKYHGARDNGRHIYLTGIDTDTPRTRLFQLAIAQSSPPRLGYYGQNGSLIMVGDLPNHEWQSFHDISLNIGRNSYAISIDGVEQTNNIAFRDAAAKGFSMIEFGGNHGSIRGYFDNFVVTREPPAATVLILR